VVKSHQFWDAGAVGDGLRYAFGGTHLLSVTSLLFPAADSELPTACA
jgi:hypothetical protein